MEAEDYWCDFGELVSFPTPFLSLLFGKYKRLLSYDFCIQFGPHSLKCYMFCFWCLLQFIFYSISLLKHFISFNFCIQFDPNFFITILFLSLSWLIYFFSNLFHNILFYLIIVFKFHLYYFDCYVLPLSWFIYVFQFCSSTFYFIYLFCFLIFDGYEFCFIIFLLDLIFIL